MTKKTAQLSLLLVVQCAVCYRWPCAQTALPGTDIYLAPLTFAAGAVTVGPAANITSRSGYDNQPCFSLDGTLVLYTSADTSGATDIYAYDIEGRTTLRITNTAESEYSPTAMEGTRSFSTVRVESGGVQRLWRFDIDGTHPHLVLSAVDSVGYHTWVDDRTLGLFVLGEPHTLRVADTLEDTDRIVASDIGRCLCTVAATGEISYVQIVSETESWISAFDVGTGVSRRLVRTLPGSQDYTWMPEGGILMASGSALFLWTGQGKWAQVHDFGPDGPQNITRLAVGATGRLLALVADDS